MGSAVSKSPDSSVEDFSESNLPSSPVSTPNIRRVDWDPRSPSTDIARTPIEVLRTPAETNIMENSLNITEDLDCCYDDNILKCLDPRSPTTEFHRTPIIPDAAFKIHNKNLDKARAPHVTVTPTKPRKISEKVIKKIYSSPEASATQIVSAINAESSCFENKRNSIVGLLETNIDFVETDLDFVIQNKIWNKLDSSLTDTASPTLDSQDPPSVIIGNTSNIVNYDSTHETANAVAECVSTAEISAVKVDSKELNTEAAISLIVSQEQAKDPNTDVNNAFSVEELDRKLTNLIYEDKLIESIPKLIKQNVSNNRTPLGDRNNQQRKSIPVLKVSDKPTRPTATISKIPVFKEKKIKAKLNIQCENTPPRMMTKHSQWAAEDSLII